MHGGNSYSGFVDARRSVGLQFLDPVQPSTGLERFRDRIVIALVHSMRLT